jgi:hypothetical protein
LWVAKQYATDEPTIYHFRDKHANHDTTNEPTIYCFQQKNVNHYATNGTHNLPVGSSGRVRVLLSKAVDRGFIGGVMVSVLVLKAVNHYATDEPMTYGFGDKYANHYANE